MIVDSSLMAGFARLLRVAACLLIGLAASSDAIAQQPAAVPASAPPQEVHEAGPRWPRQPELGPPLPVESGAMTGSYREFRHRLDSDPNYILELSPDVLPPISDIFNAVPNRWALEQPDYRRYRPAGEYIYTKPHWYDPFNRNRFKGDEPIWPAVLGQQVFLNVTGSGTTFIVGRQVPVPSGVSAAQPGSSAFFGPGEQFFFA